MSALNGIARSLWPEPGDRHGPLVPMMVALTFLTGVVDAASYLRLAVLELTTTVLTRTLTGLASEAGLVGGRGSHSPRRAVAVAAMLLGALTGGLLALHASVAAALAVACAIVGAVGLAVHLASRSGGAWTRA